MQPRQNGPQPDSESRPGTDRLEESPNPSCPLSPIGTDGRGLLASTGFHSPWTTTEELDGLGIHSVLREVQLLLGQMEPYSLPEGCRKLLSQAELRVCFLRLHHGSSQLASREWRSIHSRSETLRQRLNRSR